MEGITILCASFNKKKAFTNSIHFSGYRRLYLSTTRSRIDASRQRPDGQDSRNGRQAQAGAD